jgi:hypothetical protein
LITGDIETARDGFTGLCGIARAACGKLFLPGEPDAAGIVATDLLAQWLLNVRSGTFKQNARFFGRIVKLRLIDRVRAQKRSRLVRIGNGEDLTSEEILDFLGHCVGPSVLPDPKRRKDAKYGSNRERQKAYRERLKNKVSRRG